MSDNVIPFRGRFEREVDEILDRYWSEHRLKMLFEAEAIRLESARIERAYKIRQHTISRLLAALEKDRK